MRVSAAIVATAGLALLCSACGGASGTHIAQLGTTATQSSTLTGRPASALAFSHCMRSHGVSQFPDPDSSGAIPKVGPQELGVGSSQLQTAQTACGHLLQPTSSQVEQTMSGMLDFAHCMRSHGVHAWPDPTTESGQPVFDLHGLVNPDSHQMDVTSGKCAHLLQPAPGQDGAVLCNGIGEAGCHHYG